MPGHRLDPGKDLIDGLLALGDALGYTVQPEFPVIDGLHGSPAVDVAWLTEPGQYAPLMIFEVESHASNGMANNALKVYSQPSEDFLKPLYFFHIVLRASTSSRIEMLRRAYGTQNYGCFNLREVPRTVLLEKILAQHRRIAGEVAIDPLLACLRHDAWSSVRPPDLVVMLLELGLKGDWGPSLAHAAIEDSSVREGLIEWLTRILDMEVDPFGTEDYITTICGYPMALGLVAYERPALTQDMVARFRIWQQRDGRMKSIGPYWGLSYDYDQFLIMVPGILALWCALMPPLVPDLVVVLRELRKSTRAWLIPNAIWSLHVAAAFEMADEYSAARDFLNDFGGINVDYLWNPLFIYSPREDDEGDWLDPAFVNPSPIPPMDTFRECAHRYVENVESSSLSVAALQLLSDYGAPISRTVLQGLYQTSRLQAPGHQ